VAGEPGSWFAAFVTELTEPHRMSNGPRSPR
jgi:hypothetical protein